MLLAKCVHYRSTPSTWIKDEILNIDCGVLSLLFRPRWSNCSNAIELIFFLARWRLLLWEGPTLQHNYIFSEDVGREVLYIQGRDINYFLICKEGFTDSSIFQAQGSLPEAMGSRGGGLNLNVEVFNVENNHTAFIINKK